MKVETTSRKKNIFIVIAAFLLLVPNFLPISLIPLPDYGYSWEQFEPDLVPQIQSVDQLLAKADSIAVAKLIHPDSLAYVVELNRLVKKRFYHGYSHYRLSENWISAVLGKLLWDHLSAVVLPDDLLKYPMAACSQQSIVLMEALKRKGINYRKIGFDHHFALEAQFGQKWCFFDPDMEPDYTVVPRGSIDSLLKNAALYTIYKNRLDSAGVHYTLANPFYGVPNAHPTPRASHFHRITKIFSKVVFLLPFLFLVFPINRRKGAIKNVNPLKQQVKA